MLDQVWIDRLAEQLDVVGSEPRALLQELAAALTATGLATARASGWAVGARRDFDRTAPAGAGDRTLGPVARVDLGGRARCHRRDRPRCLKCRQQSPGRPGVALFGPLDRLLELVELEPLVGRPEDVRP